MDRRIFGSHVRSYQDDTKDYSGDEKSDEKKDSEDDVDVKDDDREKDTVGESDDDDDDDGEMYIDSDLEKERNWKNVNLRNARPPHPLTVTHVNQTRDLQRVDQSLAVVNADQQNSEEWLQTHSVEFLRLTLQDLIDKGQIGKLTPDKQTGRANHQIQFEAYDVNEFEYKLNVAIEMYTKRIKYLLQGSKRIFGHLKGDRVALCVDVSDANMGFGRQTAFQESLLHLLDEQLSEKSGLYLMEFGTEPEPLWPVTRDVNCRIVDEAKEWVMRLQPRGGCNLLKAMKHLMKVKDVDTIVLVLGSVPDQPTDILCDFVHQMGVGKEVPLHAVAYDCSNQLTNVTLRNLAEASKGRYHCYAASCEELIYTGTDISLLLKEIQRAQDVINKIKEMRRGLMGSALVNIMNEITTEVSKLPQSRFLPRPPGHELPLRIDTPKFQPRSSVDWLCQHGLKAKRLDLYQVLSPNAYSYREEFIPIIKKAVQSQVHEKAMVQFTWHDGSVKNIHVDMTQLFEYQKQLKDVVGLYERRIDWLASGGRRIFGTICEKNIVILIDTSVSNVNYLVHIQHSLRLLMEQQIANKDYFNLIAFGSIAKSWRPTMVRPTPQNLQDAWNWVLGLQCSGSRNFLAAFRLAAENEEEVKHKIHIQGVYLFTSGVPDQPQDVAISFLEEASSGRPVKLHSILFNVDDYDGDGAIPGRYANITRTSDCLRNMAHCSGGRFHWFRETGIIESDDIQFVNTEVDKALNFSRKVALLIDNVKKKYHNRFQTVFPDKMSSLPSPDTSQPKSLPPTSRQGATTRQSQRHDDDVDSLTEQLANSRGIAWRPASASKVREPKHLPKPPCKERPTSAKERPSSARDRKDPLQRVRPLPSKKISCTHFFLDKKQEIGSVYTKYQNTKVVRKSIGQPTIPEQEDPITSKEWLRLFGLSKLKLDLTKLVSGPDCKHAGKKVKSLHKNVSAKYCDIFPSINIKGTLKHLQLLPHELEDYENQVERVLRRYLKRLQWLLSGSRRVFGTVIQNNCIFLIDTSGSMDVCMKELKKEMAALIWEQLNQRKINFNLIRFSGTCEKWRGRIQPPTEENCHDAIAWSSKFVASGNTCTLEALQMAFGDPEVEGVYLLTDGKPDTSTSLVLREVAALNANRTVPVNTISFNCSDNTANNFLHLLAKETGGRYHRCHGDFDAQMFTHKLLSEGFQDAEYPHLPQFDGDDLRRLGAEITQARKYIAQARTFRALYNAKSMNAEKEKMCSSEKVPSTPFLVGRPK